MTFARCACALLALLAPQVVPQTSVSIQGRVVNAADNQPIAYARVVVARVAATAVTDDRTVEADDAGRFVIPDLTAGTYRVFAQRDGFLPAEYGRRLAGTTGTPVAVNAGQPTDIVMPMTAAGAIAGRVTDHGKAARDVVVRAMKPEYLNGQRSLRVREWAISDDRGEFRLFGLAPGSYVVSAMPARRPRLEGDRIVVPVMPSNASSNRSELSAPATPETLDASVFARDVFVPAYYPGPSDASSAMPIEVRAGETTNGIDLALAATAVFHVRGRVMFSGITAPAAPVAVWLRPVQAEIAMPSPSGKDDGHGFDVADVPPGRYFAFVSVPAPGNRSLFATAPVEVVNADIDGVVVTVQPAVALTGRVTVNGQAPVAGDPPVLIQLQTGNALPGASAMRLQADGTFLIDNVSPGDYRFRVLQAGRAPWIKSAAFGGADVRVNPIHVESDLQGRQLLIDLGTNTATLDASVLDRSRQPIAGAVVVAVPDAARRGRSDQFHAATTDAAGRAHLEGLAPGEYRLFASTEIDAGAWQDPDVIRQYESAGEVVRVIEGGRATVTLRITP